MSTWEKDELKVSLIGNKKVIIKMINTIYRNLKMSEHIEDSESIEMIRKTIHNFQSKKIYRHYLLEYCDSYHKDSLGWMEESNKDKEEIGFSLHNLVWLNEIKELSNGEWLLKITDSSTSTPEDSWKDIIEKNGFRLGVVDYIWIEDFKGYFISEYPQRTYIIERQDDTIESKLCSFEPDSLIKGDVIPIHFGLLKYQQLLNEVYWCDFLLEDVIPKPEGERLKSILKDKEESLGLLNEFKNQLSDLFGVKNDENLIDTLYSLEFLV
ncbi:MAG: hypothetical protein J1E63_09460 [Muribaculaceae bacterium]|nr:hypothetical protein [Muribaculaceae bacterium]